MPRGASAAISSSLQMRPSIVIEGRSLIQTPRDETGLAALLKAAAFIERQDEGIDPPSPRHQEDLKAPAPPGIVQCRANRRFAISASSAIGMRHDVLKKAVRRATTHQVGRRDQKAGRDRPIFDDTNH